ncbi:MAG: S8 family serine peptidase [Balneola sp.]
MKKHILKLYLFVGLFLGFTVSTIAQNTIQYKDRDVRPNSIIVKYDDTLIKAKGISITPQQMAFDVRSQINGSVVTTFKNINAEEWEINGDLESSLKRLNSIPGVRAFPNYIFHREELSPVMLDESKLGTQLTQELHGTDRTRPATKIRKSLSLANLESFTPINRLYDENFDDTASVNAEWTVVDFAGSGQVWSLQETSMDDFIFEIVTDTSLNSDTSATVDVATDLYAPQFDMTGLDSTKSYRLRVEYTNGFSDAFIGLYLEGAQGDLISFDLSTFTNFYWVDISSYVGDTLTADIYVEKIGAADGEFLASVENVSIEEYPTDDALVELQYGLYNDGLFASDAVEGADVSAFDAWQTTTGSDDVVVVVYDDGVDFNHDDLRDNAWINIGEDLNDDGVITEADVNGVDDDGNGYPDDFWGWSAVYDDNSFLNPGSFHGTHVAGILGAQGNNGIGVSGVAQDVSIISVMIFDEFGSTDAISIMRGYDYISSLLDNGVEITAINQSWGGGGSLFYESDVQFVSVMTEYALHHASYEALWVISAGNSASNRDELNFYSYPNNIQSPNIITVANTDWADRLSGTSDFGIRTVDIGAPGSSIVSTFLNNGYAYLSGTSMSSPHVTGAIALAKAAYPDEGGFALAARVLASTDGISSLNGAVGEGGRLNANGSVDLTSEGAASGLIPTHSSAFFHRTFIDEESMKVIGFVNNTESAVTVTDVTLSGEGAFAFSVEAFESLTVPAGGAFGVPVGFDNVGSSGEILASADIQTSGGTVSVGLNGKEQAFGVIELSSGVADLGPVSFGTELNTSFDILNNGDKDLQYGIGQNLFIFDLEFSNQLAKVNNVPIAQKLSNTKSPVDLKATMDMITAQVLFDRGNKNRKKIKYSPSGNLENHDEEVIFSDDLNDSEVTLEQWDLVSFGTGEGEGLNWELFDLGDGEGGVDNVFLAGDFEIGYVNNFLPIAIAPSFDFSELENEDGQPQAPAYLKFDYSASLEEDFDFFYVNVISNGQRLTTLDITDLGTLINDGTVYSAFLDISEFAGLDDVEFWFIVNTDGSFTDGFGALFDNVEVVVRDAPFYTSSFDGTVPAGVSQTVDVTVRTELLPPGDFVLATQVFSDAINAFYFGNPQHLTFFESRFVNVSIDPEYQDIGIVSKDEPFSFDFSATNTGALSVDYFADVFLSFNNNGAGDFANEFTSAKKEAQERFQEAEKDREQFNPLEHKNFLIGQLKNKKVKPFKSNGDMPNITPRFSMSNLESEDIYAEDFEEGELPEGWELEDASFGLGSIWSVENVGTEESPFQGLFVGDPDNFIIYDNTRTVAFSPSIDLSEIPDGQNPVLEFDYGFLLEPGFDFGSVWVGVETEEETQFFLIGGTEDVFFNDGFVYRTRVDLSAYKGADNVFFAFVVETDQSVQSSFAFIDNLLVRTESALAYIEPAAGTIDSATTQEFSVTVNTPSLFPGNYTAISAIDYFSEESFTGRVGFQYTDFSIPNLPPVAVNDTVGILAGDVVSLDVLLGFILSNDSDPDGQVFLEDFSDPLYGNLKYVSQDLGLAYVAPLNYDGLDIMGYSITDGQSSDTAVVYISVFANPEFVKGSDQQYVFLEDNNLTLNTAGMAAGVGGQDADLHVWARAHSDDITLTADAANHKLTMSATEDYFGQTSATLYVGYEDDPIDSMDVSIVVVPVNDAPTAAFTSSGTSSDFQFTDASSDPKDATDGGIVSWSWDFGDGSTSDEQNPAHSYTEIGNYTVILTVTDNGGLTAESQEIVEVQTVVSTEDVTQLPTSVELDQNYPNPFNPSTTIRFGLPEAGAVQLEVYNALGQKVTELVNGRKAAGWHTISFDASQLASGLYIYRITSGSFVKTNKMLLIK